MYVLTIEGQLKAVLSMSFVGEKKVPVIRLAVGLPYDHRDTSDEKVRKTSKILTAHKTRVFCGGDKEEQRELALSQNTITIFQFRSCVLTLKRFLELLREWGLVVTLDYTLSSERPGIQTTVVEDE